MTKSERDLRATELRDRLAAISDKLEFERLSESERKGLLDESRRLLDELYLLSIGIYRE